MKFSILIANYNNEEYFTDCYNSITAQTYKKWEVIIVDDCSTDNSIKTIERITKNDSRFKLIKNETNKGCGYTKRKALEFASGTICGFLDPDDALTKDALELSVSRFKEEDIIAAYSKITFCDETLKPVEDYKKIKKIFNNKYFFNCPTQINAFFSFKKSAYDKTNGINPELESAVDQDLYLKVLEHGEVSFIEENLYLYRRHPKGISQSCSKNKAKENFAKVIYRTFKRRNIKKIYNQEIPENYPGAEKIYELLEYQNSIVYRLFLKVRLHLPKLFQSFN